MTVLTDDAVTVVAGIPRLSSKSCTQILNSDFHANTLGKTQLCFKCSRPSYFARKCPMRRAQLRVLNRTKGIVRCYKCGQIGPITVLNP